MARLRVEFTVEPFVEGRIGPHVEAAVAAAQAGGVEVEVGPFGSTFEADATVATRALASLVESAFANGATRLSCQLSSRSAPEHPLTAAVRPLADALGAELIDAADARPGDVPLRWEGMVVAAARMPDRVSSIHGALAQLIADVEREMGGPLAEMSRGDKQLAARSLYDRGAFALRNAADEVADAMGVSRVTIYNYLNAVRSS